jgi:hypothetical protein
MEFQVRMPSEPEPDLVEVSIVDSDPDDSLDGELAKPDPGAPGSRIVKRAGVYESLPAEWGSVFGAGDPVAEHCGVFQD